jgi:hypothetical protein
LQRSYGNQAVILKAWGGWRRPWRCSRKWNRLESLALELGDKDSLQKSHVQLGEYIKGGS